jgi:hypothetical protein
MTKGSKAKWGMVLNICKEESRKVSIYLQVPVIKPKVRPKLPPIKNPKPALRQLILRLAQSSPLKLSRKKAFKTFSGEGRILGFI